MLGLTFSRVTFILCIVLEVSDTMVSDNNSLH